MLYEEARVYLDHVSKYGSVLGLDSIKSLLGELGNPQNDLKFIHIAGTNGKGSMLAMLSGILEEAGYRVGRYISPTVLGYEERFQINRIWMAEDELALFVSEVKEAAERTEQKYNLTPTVFEIETAIAFLYFQRKHCDYVVLETGMGGLTDATNVVETTELCVFASISMDHLGILGNTLEEIAQTKSGIMKKGADVVSARQKEYVSAILEAKAEMLGCRFVMVEPEQTVIEKESLERQVFSYKEYEHMKLGLLGRYQTDNAATVLEAVEMLKKRGVFIPQEAVRKGMETVCWPGRFQVLSENPLVIADGAHNEDASLRLAENIRTYLPGKKIYGVMGVFRDKEYEKMLEILSPYLTEVCAVDLPNRERTLEKEALKKAASAAGIPAKTAETIEEALRQAEKDAGEEGTVLVFGSLSYLGEVIRKVEGKEEASW